MTPPDNHSALDVLRDSFTLLVTGPRPLCLEAGAVADVTGLPARDMPMDEVRELLLDRYCPWELRDAVWRVVIERARHGGREGATWTVAACGLLLPALTTIAAIALAGVAGREHAGDIDRAQLCDEINAEILVAMVAALGSIDTSRAGIVSRLRWTAVRAARGVVRDALAAPTPAGSPAATLWRGRDPLASTPASLGTDPASSAANSAVSGGAIDTSAVVAHALAAGVLSVRDARLIIATRLDGEPLRAAGARLGLTSYSATRSVRSRAEKRLVAHLSTPDGARDEGTRDESTRDDAGQVRS